MDILFASVRVSMTTKNIKKDFIRKVVAEWYGMPGMPLTIMTREEERERYEQWHPEVPPSLWEFIDHKKRQGLMWARDAGVDVVIREEGSYKLVQDIFFKDAFDSDAEWREKCQEWIAHAEEVWFVIHDEVYLG